MPKTQSTAKLKKNMKRNVNLRETMLSRMDSARLRFLNDEMYNNNKSVLKKKTAFKVYHDSFDKQQKLWDSNPLDIIIKDLKSQYSKCLKKDEFVIADLGCGVARIADEFEETEAKVHSIDFVAVNKKVTACDMTHTNILGLSVDIVVFCLSLMSSNCNSYIKEAKRILNPSGLLLIAEVTSRIGNEQAFIEAMKSYGFSLNGKTYSEENMLQLLQEAGIVYNRSVETLSSCIDKIRTTVGEGLGQTCDFSDKHMSVLHSLL